MIISGANGHFEIQHFAIGITWYSEERIELFFLKMCN
jgi:hypothetical protein